MKLLTFTKDGVRRVGLFKDGRILDLPEAYRTVYDTLEAPDFLYDMRRLIALGEPALEVARRLGEEARCGVVELAFFATPRCRVFVVSGTSCMVIKCVG